MFWLPSSPGTATFSRSCTGTLWWGRHCPSPPGTLVSQWPGSSCEENGFRKAPHWGLGRLAWNTEGFRCLQNTKAAHSQPSPVTNLWPSCITHNWCQVITCPHSQVMSRLSRGLALVKLGKMPNYLVFDMKVSLPKNSQERQAMLVFHPALLLCLSSPGRMVGN